MRQSTRRQRIASLLPWLLLVVALGLMFSQIDPRRIGTLGLVWIPWARVGTLAIVMTAIILTGGIDLSVGSMISLCSVVMGLLWHAGVPANIAALAAIATGLCAGAFNGGLVAIGLSPLVATLATMAAYAGLSMALASAQNITDFAEASLGWSEIGGVASEYWLLAEVFLVACLVVHYTTFGRWCYAIGDNPVAARFAAVPVRRTQWWLYTASGLVSALLAVIYTMTDGAVIDAHRGIELKAIACVVVGGTLITGGRGSIPKTLLGLAVLANMDIGLQNLGGFVTGKVRLIVIGLLLIVVAVSNQRLAIVDEHLERGDDEK